MVAGSLVLPLTGSAVVIDSFTTANVNITDSNPVDGISVSSLENGLGDVLGGSRQTRIRLTGTDGSGSVNASAAGTGVMSFSSDTLDSGTFELIYNGGGSGLGNLQGSGETFVYILFTAADASSDVRVIARTGATTVSVIKSHTGAGLLKYYFSEFEAINPAIDFGNIALFDFYITGDPSGDYAIDQVGTDLDRGVPDAAGTMALLSIALGLLGAARLKMKE